LAELPSLLRSRKSSQIKRSKISDPKLPKQKQTGAHLAKISSFRQRRISGKIMTALLHFGEREHGYTQRSRLWRRKNKKKGECTPPQLRKKINLFSLARPD
jgi:hypothetical protein